MLKRPALIVALAASAVCSYAATTWPEERDRSDAPAASVLVAQTPAAEQRGAAAPSTRPGYKGIYPGMRASDLPRSLTATSNIGEREGFVGDDYIQVQVVYDVVTQVHVVYWAPVSGSMPSIDRRISLADAFRVHGPSKEVPPFALYLSYLQRIDGLMDTQHFMAYRLRFQKPEFSRDAPALFHPDTRVERVIYAVDRVELAFNHQPIASRALLQRIADEYRRAVGQ